MSGKGQKKSEKLFPDHSNFFRALGGGRGVRSDPPPPAVPTEDEGSVLVCDRSDVIDWLYDPGDIRCVLHCHQPRGGSQGVS